MTPEQEQLLFETIQEIRLDVEKLSRDVEKSNDKFAAYQQGTQWVVSLAFSLITSSTVIVIVTNILHR